jgi:hypothetical protein
MRRESTEIQMNADERLLSGVNGIFVGLLDDEEVKALDRLVAQGRARYVYQGAAGFMGLAKFRLTDDAEVSAQLPDQ